MAVLVMQHMGQPLTEANCDASTLTRGKEALQRLHDCDVLHGDACAANCVLACNGTVCLTDLETAQHCADQGSKQQEMSGLVQSFQALIVMH